MSTYHIPVKIIYCWPTYQLWNLSIAGPCTKRARACATY